MKKQETKKGFGDLLSDSWEEYRKNFNLILKLFILLIAIPSLIIFAVGQVLAIPSTYESVEQLSELISRIAVPFALYGILIIASIVLSMWMSTSLISTLFSKKSMQDLGESIKKGSSYLLKFIGLGIILAVFLAVLYVLLVIPGIIFTVYWAFATYVLIGENKGIIDSLKGSFNLVKGKWWRVLGYSLLFFLVVIAVNIVFSIPAFIISLITGDNVVGLTLMTLIDLAVSLIVTPLGILFYKNFYLELKASKK